MEELSDQFLKPVALKTSTGIRYFDYDEMGNVKKIKAGSGSWHEFLYTLFGGVLEYVMPTIGSVTPSVQYEYNNDKQLSKITRENSYLIEFTYGAASGLLEKIEENYQNRVGVCYKCGTVIEPMLLDQWFIDMKKLAKPAIKALKDNKITFYPQSKKQQTITITYKFILV